MPQLTKPEKKFELQQILSFWLKNLLNSSISCQTIMSAETNAHLKGIVDTMLLLELVVMTQKQILFIQFNESDKTKIKLILPFCKQVNRWCHSNHHLFGKNVEAYDVSNLLTKGWWENVDEIFSIPIYSFWKIKIKFKTAWLFDGESFDKLLQVYFFWGENESKQDQDDIEFCWFCACLFITLRNNF